ncbi:MAG: MerR family transcriptional regulator [Nocardiopsaceae bacterium]|nr:MerR family transcriptional regulator [Nocardiopsaceae bacterium]
MTSGHQAYIGIGQVLAELRGEFGDISPSKIRFLEAEGLIRPARAQSGYRRFARADVERLRYILIAQRDEYLPLRVIRQRLEAMDEGTEPAPETMTRSELLAATGADEALLAELEDYGLIRRARQYGTDAATVVRCAASLREFGIQPRHLRAVKAAADREVSLVEQVAAPLSRRSGSREPALRVARDAAAHIARLHASLVEDGLTDAGLASAPAGGGRYPGMPAEPAGCETAPGLRSASQ